MERSILKLPLSKLCAVPLALQNRAFFERRKGRRGAEERGEEGGGPVKEAKRKIGRVKTILFVLLLVFLFVFICLSSFSSLFFVLLHFSPRCPY